MHARQTRLILLAAAIGTAIGLLSVVAVAKLPAHAALADTMAAPSSCAPAPGSDTGSASDSSATSVPSGGSSTASSASSTDDCTSGSTPTSAGSGPTFDGDHWLAVLLLLFGLSALGLVYYFLNKWRASIASWIQNAYQHSGRYPDYTFNPTETPQGFGADGAAIAGSAPLAIRGPLQVFVGEAATFTALLGDSAAPDGCTWSAIPAEAVTLVPGAPSSTVSVTASKPGPIALTVTNAGTSAYAPITAVAASSDPGRIPIIGGGYGGVTIALVAITVAASLTAIGVFPGAALATLLGTVVGYFFVNKDSGGAGSGGGAGS